jgi:hypothetical protein
MKFLALVKKEFRECLPWMCLAFIACAGFALLALRVELLSNERTQQVWTEGQWVPWCASPLSNVGLVLTLTSLGLGLAMGVRQFSVPAFDKTWTFTLHRPVGIAAIVHAKFVSALLGLILSVGVPWTALYMYAAVPGRFGDPVLPGVFWKGWFLIAVGLVPYLGTAVTSLRRARWYGTRIFGLIFAFWIVSLVLSYTPFRMAIVVLAVGLIVLGIQVYALVRSKEF